MTTEVPEPIKRPFNGHTEKVLKAVQWIVSAAITITVAYVTLQGAVQMNSDDICENATDIKVLEARVDLSDQFMVEQRVHNEWTKETLTEIKQAIKEIH